jgi:hypothetical protein
MVSVFSSIFAEPTGNKFRCPIQQASWWITSLTSDGGWSSRCRCRTYGTSARNWHSTPFSYLRFLNCTWCSSDAIMLTEDYQYSMRIYMPTDLQYLKIICYSIIRTPCSWTFSKRLSCKISIFLYICNNIYKLLKAYPQQLYILTYSQIMCLHRRGHAWPHKHHT